MHLPRFWAQKANRFSSSSIRLHLHLSNLVIIEWHNGASPFSQRCENPHTHPCCLRDLVESAYIYTHRRGRSLVSLHDGDATGAANSIIILSQPRIYVLLQLNCCFSADSRKASIFNKGARCRCAWYYVRRGLLLNHAFWIKAAPAPSRFEIKVIFLEYRDFGVMGDIIFLLKPSNINTSKI